MEETVTQENLKDPLFARFWKFLKRNKETDCWEFTGAKRGSNGYGAFWVDGRHTPAHRFMYSQIVGEPGELLVCHTCDVPRCCNPNHLFLGTHKDNAQDMVRKGRHGNKGGDEASRRKLTQKEVEEIRKMYATGKYFQYELGEMFGVDQSNVSIIVNHKRWKKEKV